MNKALVKQDIVGLVDRLIRAALDGRASDVHFEPAERALRVRYRVDAMLHDIEEIPGSLAPNVIARLKVLAGLLTYRTDQPQEGAISAEHGYPSDIRVATFPTIHGERVVLRLLSTVDRVLRLAELGLAPETTTTLRHLITQPQGLLIVCGPAGSGKTTTLHALLGEVLAMRPGDSVVALEDPVEIRQAGLTQVPVHAERGFTYAKALRSMLRQDPQVLMIGEIRDAETAGITMEAALSGHLLFTTLHSNSPANALVRLLDMGLPAYQITSVLIAILAQRLLRRCCTACGGVGGACDACLGTGFNGRTAIGSLVAMTPPLREAILAHADAEKLAALMPANDLHADAKRLVAEGRTTEAEVARVLGRLG
jgi:type II secretory ATPase GspE/PulE/Tfp pilus assembly ATPase PilB-like protein